MSANLTPASEKEDGDKQTDIKSPLTKLKDTIFFAGKVNQSINQFRRNHVNLSLPAKLTKLGKKEEESSAWIFGDSVSESIDPLENKQRFLLKDKISKKRMYSEQ